MAGRLVNALGSATATAEAFSDTATLRHMLRFEAALAQAAAAAGLIPKKFAPVIAQACDPALYDAFALAEDPVLQMVEPARRGTLIAKRDGDGRWQLPIHLGGPKETVFFDI